MPTDVKESPFKPGVKVMMKVSHYQRKYEEHVVERVYKSGRITLRGRAEKYEPRPDDRRVADPIGKSHWRAIEVRDEIFASDRHAEKYRDVVDHFCIKSSRDITPDTLAKIAALLGMKESEEQ